MSLSSLFDILHPTDFLRSALNMLTEYEQAKEDNDRPKMVSSHSRPFLPLSLTVFPPNPQRLWKRPKRHTGVGDYAMNMMPDSSDTYLAVPHMVFQSPLLNFTLILTICSPSRSTTHRPSSHSSTSSPPSTQSLPSSSGPRPSRTHRSTC